MRLANSSKLSFAPGPPRSRASRSTWFKNAHRESVFGDGRHGGDCWAGGAGDDDDGCPEGSGGMGDGDEGFATVSSASGRAGDEVSLGGRWRSRGKG